LSTSMLFNLLRRHALLIVTCVLLGGAAATAVATFLITPSYLVTTKLYVSGAGTDPDERLKNGEYARTHVSSYTDMIDSNDLLQAVRRKMNLPLSDHGGYQDLADSITATNPLETVVIYVYVQDSSPTRAQAVAQAIGEVYDPVVADVESASGKASPVRIRVYSTPSVPTAPHSPSRKVYLAAGLALGLAIGAALSWLLDLRRASSRRRLRSFNDEWPDSWNWGTDAHEVVVRPIRGELGHKAAARATQAERDSSTERNSAAQ
jgi:capsular polysaccharide biosynthesis protein